jgi:hypothetical protein
MKTIIGNTIAVLFMGLCLVVLPHQSAYAGGEIKEVCKDKLDKAGKPVMKDGKAVQACKKIKVHKKLEGTAVPVKK